MSNSFIEKFVEKIETTASIEIAQVFLLSIIEWWAFAIFPILIILNQIMKS